MIIYLYIVIKEQMRQLQDGTAAPAASVEGTGEGSGGTSSPVLFSGHG